MDRVLEGFGVKRQAAFDPWTRFLQGRQPREWHYLFAFDQEADAPIELRSPFGERDGLRTWKPVGAAIDALQLPGTAFIVAAAVPKRCRSWDAHADCLHLSVLRRDGREPDVIFFRLDEWKRKHVADGEATR